MKISTKKLTDTIAILGVDLGFRGRNYGVVGIGRIVIVWVSIFRVPILVIWTVVGVRPDGPN